MKIDYTLYLITDQKLIVPDMLPKLKELKLIRSAVSKPIVAIGGIHEEQAELLNKTGIHGIAVVSAILSSSDIQSAAKRLRRQFEGRKDKV